MATQRAMKCNLFRLGITPREDTIRLTRRTPRSNCGPVGRERRGGKAGCARPKSSLYGAMGMRRNCERALLHSRTTLFDTGEEGSKDNVSLEFTIGPVFRVPARLSCDNVQPPRFNLE